MFTEYLIFLLILVYQLAVAFSGNKVKKKAINNVITFYLKDIIVSLFIIGLLLLLKSDILKRIDFTLLGKGLVIPQDILSGILPIFFIPLLVSIFQRQKSEVVESDQEVMGFPVRFLPKNYLELCVFTIYIFIGVIFEELLCRQILFRSLYVVFGLKGDYILLAASGLFALAHFYQGIKGVISAFLGGLILGKLFQVNGSIVYPIVFHLVFNLALCVMAYKRLFLRKEHLPTNEKSFTESIERKKELL